MFIPLEGQGIVSLDRVVALVREDNETAIYLKDGSVMATGFKPETLAKRYRNFMGEARKNRRVMQQGGDIS
ncbi:MAG: hypothetical protein JW971_00935 [Synergistales bacterium]|nr:hypothetical protein [Synergistales bacterium]